MSKTKAAFCGLLAGFIAGLAMTLAMLLLAWLFWMATPLAIMGDRLSVWIKPTPFFWIMGKVGGYNHLKELGVCSAALGQIVVGALGGMVYGLVRRRRRVPFWQTFAVFLLLPLLAMAALLWPVLGTHYGGWPIDIARLITLLGLALSFFVFERTLVVTYESLVRLRSAPEEFSPALGRRAFLAGAAGLVLAGGIYAVGRKLFRRATFSYDGTQYKGAGVQAITPNDQFYCVTKNVIDPRVDDQIWHLEVVGLVQNPATYRIHDFNSVTMIDQETTLMCISNGLDAGLISNAVWNGMPLADLLQKAGVRKGAARVKLYGVDNYTDTIPLAKALEPTTLIAFKMNGEDLPDRHGFPARAIVPGYFGEKHVKWLTRIEVTDDSAKGFYEAQGWGPDFVTPTRSRIDVPENEAWIKTEEASRGILVRGIAYGGDRGVAKVELSLDHGSSWEEAKIDYPGTKLTWALWSHPWRPQAAGDYSLIVRATDGEGEVQEYEEDRAFTSGITGFHQIAVHIYA